MIKTGFDGFLFDMDGTLLHTLPDLMNTANHALEKEGFPARSYEEILSFVGNGALALVIQAVPDNATEEEVERVFDNFKNMYAEFGFDQTRPFNGMEEVLATLKNHGKKLGIMSNKFERGVKDVEDFYFSGIFDASHGETKTIPRKPDPTGLLTCAEEMGVSPDRCIYFGDSASDVMAAHNAGMYAVGVTWGYQPVERIKTGEPDALIDDPKDILSFL